MSALTVVAGFAPVHRVVAYARWVDPAGAAFTDWRAACDVTRTERGWARALGRAGGARVHELCRVCFPGQDATGAFPAPADHSRPDGRPPTSLRGAPPERGTPWPPAVWDPDAVGAPR